MIFKTVTNSINISNTNRWTIQIADLSKADLRSNETPNPPPCPQDRKLESNVPALVDPVQGITRITGGNKLSDNDKLYFIIKFIIPIIRNIIHDGDIVIFNLL